jgi:hypothetical protein
MWRCSSIYTFYIAVEGSWDGGILAVTRQWTWQLKFDAFERKDI